MDTTIITNILFLILSIFLIIAIIIFGFLTSYIISILKSLKLLINKTEEKLEKVAADIESIKIKAKYSQIIFNSIIMHSLSFIKKILKK